MGQIKCAIDPCKAILNAGERIICSDCRTAIVPIINIAVETEQDSLLELWETKCEAIRKAVLDLNAQIDSDLAEFCPNVVGGGRDD